MEPNPKKGLRIKQLTISILMLFVITWLVIASGFWAFQKYHRGFFTVRYSSILIPSRWNSYKADKSHFYISHGTNLVQQGRLEEALHFLSAGTANSHPSNNSGRILLAELYLAGKSPGLSKRLISKGFPLRHYDRSYVEDCLRLLTQLRDDETILQIAHQSWAAHEAPPSASNTLIATAAVSAALNLKDYTQAKKIAAAHLSDDAETTACMLARIEWETSHSELAIARLHHHITTHPTHDQARFALINYYHTLKRFSHWETAVIEHVIANPAVPLARINYLHLQRHKNDRSRETKEIDAYLSDFKPDSRALLLLADYAVQTGQPRVAKLAESALSEQVPATRVASLLVIESHLATGEYGPALDLISNFTHNFPDWAAHYAPIFHGLRAIAYSALSKELEARVETEALVSQKNLAPETLLPISDRLTALGATDLSRIILHRTLEAEPQHYSTLLKLIQLELDTGNATPLPHLLASFPATRKPPRDLLQRAYHTLGRDQHLFTPGQGDALAKTRRALAAAPSPH